MLHLRMICFHAGRQSERGVSYMSADPAAAPAPVSTGEASAVRKAKNRPTKPLPTNRMAFQKQLDVLRAYAAVNATTGRAVLNKEVGEVVGLTADTVSLANYFFGEIGLLTKGDGGYSASPEVTAFHRAYEWTPDTASYKLAPRLMESWFAKVLLPRLNYRPIAEEEAISLIGQDAQAGKEYTSQLGILVDYLVSGGVVEREGDKLKLRKNIETTPPQPSAPGPAPKEVAKPQVTTAFAQAAEGRVAFNVSVIVDMAEFAGWQPDRITAFFGGIAQVLAAKGAIEKEAGSS